MNGKNSRAIASCLAAAAVVAMAMSGIAKDSPDFVRITPSQLVWRDVPDGHGVQQATVFGDPDKPGFYMVYTKWTKGNHFSRPHFHPNDRYIAVLQGTWWVGTGPKFDPANTTPLPAGSFVTHFGKQVHWDGAKDEDAVLLIMGEGPATATGAEEK